APRVRPDGSADRSKRRGACRKRAVGPGRFAGTWQTSVATTSAVPNPRSDGFVPGAHGCGIVHPLVATVTRAAPGVAATRIRRALLAVQEPVPDAAPGPLAVGHAWLVAAAPSAAERASAVARHARPVEAAPSAVERASAVARHARPVEAVPSAAAPASPLARAR